MQQRCVRVAIIGRRLLAFHHRSAGGRIAGRRHAVGGAAEIIDEGRNGFFAPPADVPALSEAVIHALGSTPEEREGVRRAARETAQRFSFKATAGGVLDVYRRTVTHTP